MRLLCSAGFTFAFFLAAPAFAQDSVAASSDDDVHSGGPIVVTAPYVRSLDILGNVSVLEGDELARDIRGQIGDTLTRQPGVSATSFSPGASRPVLRGFSGERVKRSEEHTSELQSLMRISSAVFCLKKKKPTRNAV